MPVVTQKFICRSDLRSNPSVMYFFGDNLQRGGLGDQAKEMRGEPNTVGVTTKVSQGTRHVNFFSDINQDTHIQVIKTDMAPAFDHVLNGGIVIVPEDSIGTGLSEPPERSPKVNAFLLSDIKRLRSINVT